MTEMRTVNIEVLYRSVLKLFNGLLFSMLISLAVLIIAKVELGDRLKGRAAR